MRVSSNQHCCTPRMNGPLRHQYTVAAAVQPYSRNWASRRPQIVLNNASLSTPSSLLPATPGASVCTSYTSGAPVNKQLAARFRCQFVHMATVEQQTLAVAPQQTTKVIQNSSDHSNPANVYDQAARLDSVKHPGLLPTIGQQQQQQQQQKHVKALDASIDKGADGLGSSGMITITASEEPPAAAAAGSDDSSVPAAAPGSLKQSGSSSSSRGLGRKGQQAVRSRAESHDYVMTLLAKNEAEEAVAAVDAAQVQLEPVLANGATDASPLPQPPAAEAGAKSKPLKQRNNKRKNMDVTPAAVPAAPAAAAAAADLGADLLSALAPAANGATSDFTALLAELAVTAAAATAAEPTPANLAAAAAVAAPSVEGKTPKKPRRRSAPAAAAAATEAVDGEAAAAQAAGGLPVVAAAVAAAVKPKRVRKRAAAAAAPAGADETEGPLAAAAADGDGRTPIVKSRRGRKKTAAAAEDVAAAAAATGSSEGDEAAAAEATPSKPVRRTKKLIAAEVAEAARLGVFNELSSLVDNYSHVALFTSSSNGNAWQQLLSEVGKAAAEGGDVKEAAAEGGDVKEAAAAAVAAAAAADGVVNVQATVLAAAAAAARKGEQLEAATAASDVLDHEQQQQQQEVGTAGGSSSSDAQAMLCKLSGLCSQQQVWLPTVYHDSLELSQPTQSYESWKEEQMQQVEAEEAAAAAAEEAAAAAAAVAEGEDGEAPEQPKSKKAKKTPQRKFTRSSSSTPYGQGVLSSQPSAPVELPFPTAAAEGDGSSALAPSTTTAAPNAAAAAAREARLLPNLGYACLCQTMRNYEVFCSRDCVKKTREGPDGLAKVSQLALANARDLLPLILWNESHGIRLFRLSSCILPWMTTYEPEELPDWLEIQKALREAGDAAKRLGHRLTFHPSEYCKIAGERPDWVTQSIQELEVHSRIFDEMGFLPASPYNKINIHVGGTYGGEKEPVLRRFAQVVNERLSPNCKARMTVENDDRANMYSVKDLMLVHELTGIPIVFDFHHWKFCTGGQTQEEAFRLALTTWPKGVRPIVHWSESPEDPDKMRSAHSDYIDGPVNLFGLEGEVDVMIESKAKELALLEYRQAVIDNWSIRPKQRNAELAAVAAAAKAEAAAARAEAKAVKAALLAEDGEGDDAVTPSRGVRKSRASAAAAIAAAAAAEDDQDQDHDGDQIVRGLQKTPNKGSAEGRAASNSRSSKKGAKKAKKKSKETSSEEDYDDLQLTDEDDDDDE